MLGDALAQWAAAGPAGAASVQRTNAQGGSPRPTLTACDPSTASVASAASGDGSLAARRWRHSATNCSRPVIEQGADLKVGNCTANGVIRDPAFRPILTASVADPSAMLDADQVRLLQQNVLKIATSCAK